MSPAAKKTLTLLLAGFALLVAGAIVLRPPRLAERSLFFVREIAAPDHVWYVDPATGVRRFIGSDAQAREVIDKAAQTLDPKELRLLPIWSPRLSNAQAEAVARWKGRFVRDDFGATWYVHEISKRRELVPDIGTLGFLIARSRELSRGELQQILVSGDSPTWLKVPEGYEADIIAGELSHPRVLGWDPAGRLTVSEHIERGRVSTFEKKGDAFVKNVVLNGESQGASHLANAHGFVFKDGRLYVASEHALEYWPYDAASGSAIGDGKLLFELPAGSDKFPGQGHRTRTLVTGRDGMIYLSIGSNCDSCDLDPDEYAHVQRFDDEGQKVETIATGLRNTVFFVENPATGELWGNEMGRDDLGEELPPDELNVIRPGKNYGWPRCYADREPVPSSTQPELCAATEPPAFKYEAHSAPLGLRFIPAQFSADWQGDLLVSFHGSTLRKRSVAGYKVVRVVMDDAGKPVGQEDVITGFLQGENIPAGRPVDLLFGPDGTLYLSDDHAGVIHRIRKK